QRQLSFAALDISKPRERPASIDVFEPQPNVLPVLGRNKFNSSATNRYKIIRDKCTLAYLESTNGSAADARCVCWLVLIPVYQTQRGSGLFDGRGGILEVART